MSNFNDCIKLLNSSKKDKSYYKTLGWSKNQLASQFNKDINYSWGIYLNNELTAFLVGDLIIIEKFAEYEILLICVKKTYRRKGLAHLLLKNFFLQTEIKLKKIYLEVAENNFPAVNLYKKNNFTLQNVRKNYYLFENKTINALCYSKKL